MKDLFFYTKFTILILFKNQHLSDVLMENKMNKALLLVTQDFSWLSTQESS